MRIAHPKTSDALAFCGWSPAPGAVEGDFARTVAAHYRALGWRMTCTGTSRDNGRGNVYCPSRAPREGSNLTISWQSEALGIQPDHAPPHLELWLHDEMN